MWSFVPRVDSRVCVRSCTRTHTNIQTYLSYIYILSLARARALSDCISFSRAQGRVQEAIALVDHPGDTFDEKLCMVNPWPQDPVLKSEP